MTTTSLTEYSLPPIPDAPSGIHFRSELERLGVDHFDEGDELPEEYRTLIVQIVMLQADLESELVFDSGFFRNVTLATPDARARMQMAKFYAEEVNHGYTFWEIAKGLGVELNGRYFREAKRRRQDAFTNAAIVQDWTELAVVNTLTDRMGVFLFNDMVECSYRPWAKVSLRVARDEVGHAALGVAHMREEIERGNGEKLQEFIDKWYPLSLDLFGNSNSERQWRYIAWGIKASPNEALRQAYVREVVPLLHDMGFTVPEYFHDRKFR